ncbi:MAG TPA: hypothetical protein VM264_07480 [Acidimicrobiales bacterium]|jgi:hypothetical protein|nr:hypothetical protein [Acidimicrobiales bacterium]
MPVVAMVLSIPFTLVILAAVLALSAVAEQRVLSPRAMVIRVVRARRTSPDFVEAFVARECAPLLARRGS